MSITTLLLALLPTVFRAKPEAPSLREKGLEAERDALREDVSRLTEELAFERRLAIRLAEEAQRLRRNDLLPLPLGGQHGPPLPLGWGQLGQQAQIAMAQMQQMQAMQNVQPGQYQQQMAQAQASPHCDCSPSRSAALLNDWNRPEEQRVGMLNPPELIGPSNW